MHKCARNIYVCVKAKERKSRIKRAIIIIERGKEE